MSGGGSQKTETTNKLSKEQRKLLGLAIPGIEDVANNTPQIYPDSAIAQFTPLQQQSQTAAVDAAVNTVDPLVQGAAATNQNLTQAGLSGGVGGLGDLIAGNSAAQPASDFITSGAVLDPSSNPFLAQTAGAAVSELGKGLQEQVLPGIRGGAQTAGQVGSSRQGIAEGRAIDSFFTQAGNATSNIFSEGYGQGLDALTGQLNNTRDNAGAASTSLLNAGQGALDQTGNMANLALLPSQILGAVGTQQQGIDQLQLSEASNNFMLEQMMPFLISQDIANLAFGAPGGSTTSTASGGGGIDPLQAILGIGSTLMGLPPIF